MHAGKRGWNKGGRLATPFIGIVILALVVYLILHLIKVPVSETEHYTEKVPYKETEAQQQETMYNETTCTKRDYAIEIVPGEVIALQENSAVFVYRIANKETKPGMFQYKLGIADLLASTIAKEEGKPVEFSSFTPEQQVEIAAGEEQQVNITVLGLRSTNPYYGELIVTPPQLEECSTEVKTDVKEIPAMKEGVRDIQKTREVVAYQTLWQKWFGK